MAIFRSELSGWIVISSVGAGQASAAFIKSNCCLVFMHGMQCLNRWGLPTILPYFVWSVHDTQCLNRWGLPTILPYFVWLVQGTLCLNRWGSVYHPTLLCLISAWYAMSQQVGSAFHPTLLCLISAWYSMPQQVGSVYHPTLLCLISAWYSMPQQVGSAYHPTLLWFMHGTQCLNRCSLPTIVPYFDSCMVLNVSTGGVCLPSYLTLSDQCTWSKWGMGRNPCITRKGIQICFICKMRHGW